MVKEERSPVGGAGIGMEQRVLGKTSFVVPRLSLGCVTFGREIDERTSFAVLDHATSAGLTLLDTAEAYGGGQSLAARRKGESGGEVREASEEFHSSELILGRWLAGRPERRERVMVQSKVTPPLTRERILGSLDASLGRLRTDYLDGFLLHAFDSNTPLEESLGAMGEAIRMGKVRHAGCSNFTAGQLSEAMGLARSGAARLEFAQFNYNLAFRDAESDLLPLCRSQGIGVQTYSPVGAGFLTGKYRGGAERVPAGSRFDLVPGHVGVYFHADKFAAAERLAALAARTGIPAARLAVAWVLRNRDVDTVLIGARCPAHIDNALAAVEITFEPEWMDELI